MVRGEVPSVPSGRGGGVPRCRVHVVEEGVPCDLPRREPPANRQTQLKTLPSRKPRMRRLIKSKRSKQPVHKAPDNTLLMSRNGK